MSTPRRRTQQQATAQAQSPAMHGGLVTRGPGPGLSPGCGRPPAGEPAVATESSSVPQPNGTRK